MQDDQDRSLVLRAQTGDQHAFGELVKTHQSLVASIALGRTGDLQRSEDIAQQAFLVAWQKIGELEDPDRFAAWVAAITRHTVSNSNRKRVSIERTAESLGERALALSGGDADSRASLAEQQERLWMCLRDIPDLYREPLVLYYRQDRSIPEVAELLDLSTDVVKKRLSRGREMIKEDAQPFVEEILGASKPGVTFCSAVIAALAGTQMTRSGATATAKKALAGTASAASSWNMWLGVYGAIYGMGAVDKNVSATIVKNQLHRFARWAMTITGFVVSAGMAAYYMAEPSIGRPLAWFGAGYLVLLIAATVYFVLRQRRHDRIHGRVKAKFEVHDLAPATPADFKKAVTGGALGAWAWLLLSAYGSTEFAVLVAAALTMLGVNAIRRAQSVSATSIPAQMRFQAASFGIHMALSIALFWIAEQMIGQGQIVGDRSLLVTSIVLLLGVTSIGSTLRAANKHERQLQSRSGTA